MVEIPELQKQISKILLSGPKTAEEIAVELKQPYLKAMEELKEMLKKELIIKDGYPTKYSLKTEIVQKVVERRRIAEKDQFKVRIRCIIDVKALEPGLLGKSLDEIEQMLRSEKAFTIYDIIKAEQVQDGEYYSSFIDANLSVKDFRAIVHLMFYYAPISVEVLKPEKIEFGADDVQDALVDMSELIHAYADRIMKLMNRKELEDFDRKLYGK